MSRTLLLMLLLAPGIVGINFFNLVRLPKVNGAMCLDGSPYGIYTFEPDPDDVPFIDNKLVIVLEDTDEGWCFQNNTSASI